MDKTRTNTIQQRFGFQDPDLKTSLHDCIMVWLDTEITSGRVAPRRIERTWTAQEVEQARQTGYRHLLDVPKDPWPNVPQLRVYSTVWEHPIMTGRDFIVGFVDLIAYFDVPCLKIEQGKWGTGFTRETWAFEVKGTIESVGELIRQIRLYQSYNLDLRQRFAKWVVVSPDTRFQSVLEGQGIAFLKAPG